MCITPPLSPEPTQNPPKQHDRRNNNPSQLQHSHFVSLARHDAQPAGAAFDARRHIGEGLGGVVDDMLVARIVVDVDCDAAQGGDFGGKGGEGVVVLSGGCETWKLKWVGGPVGYLSRSYASDIVAVGVEGWWCGCSDMRPDVVVCRLEPWRGRGVRLPCL
jgi:hypothetical protein